MNILTNAVAYVNLYFYETRNFYAHYFRFLPLFA
jgi:hypothetical protein